MYENFTKGAKDDVSDLSKNFRDVNDTILNSAETCGEHNHSRGR